MDFFSHGLWGGLVFGRKSKKSYLLAMIFGMLPDALSFGVFIVAGILGIVKLPYSSSNPASPSASLGGPPDLASIPTWVGQLYNPTHSLIVFALIFGLAWLIFKRPVWELGAWGLHVFVDIFTHSYKFFPTPFLWPMSQFKVNGIPWSSPIIFIPDIILLVVLYAWFFIAKRRQTK